MAEQRVDNGVQDTGNPVLDSTVNIVRSQLIVDLSAIRAIHAIVLELYEKEPMKQVAQAKPRRLGRPQATEADYLESRKRSSK